MGCFIIEKKLVYKFIEHSIKMNPWKGNTEYQYNFPQIPLGLKVAAWYKVLLIILNSTPVQVVSFRRIELVSFFFISI
jgi:hypothetical protein